jgi:hypothetical protein
MSAGVEPTVMVRAGPVERLELYEDVPPCDTELMIQPVRLDMPTMLMLQRSWLPRTRVT